MTYAALLAILILLAYAASLWWLLRGERAPTLLWLLALSGACLALRLIYPTQYPSGLNEDEVKILWCTVDFLHRGLLWAEDCTGLPALPSILFEAQLADLIGPTRWAIRAYSILGSVLSIPAMFAAARSLGLRIAPSLAAAGLLVVLPWSMFYGRVHQSGNMVFNELLIVASLARFMRGFGGVAEIAMSALSLCLLFYGYFCGRVLLYLTAGVSVLARGRYRLFCLLIPLIAFLGWYPYVRFSQSPHMWVGFSSEQTQEGYVEHPFETLERKTGQALEALVKPVASDQWLTISNGAIHPLLILGLALIGSLTGPRRSLFLWGGFLAGLAPTIIGHSPSPSTRRMLMAYPFISLAAACALDVVPWRRWRVAICAVVVAVVGVQSVRFYFSPDFWPPESRWVFDAERTDLVEAIPWPPRPKLIVSSGMGYFFAPRARYDRDYELLAADNWFPPGNGDVIYAFSQSFRALRNLYRPVFGDAMQTFGGAFLVNVDQGDWSWMRRFGWRYERQCGSAEPRVAYIPTLYVVEFGFTNAPCSETVTHTWRGHWNWPQTKMRFHFNGSVRVETTGGIHLAQQGWQQVTEFTLKQGDDVTIELVTPLGYEMLATLVEATADTNNEQVPALEAVSPPQG